MIGVVPLPFDTFTQSIFPVLYTFFYICTSENYFFPIF